MKIVLCGFMGSGKSNVGRRLARQLGCDFIDMDIYIETRENMKVSEIFEKKGEAYFRRLETAIIPEITEADPVVIACGGGAVMDPKNVEAFRSCGCTVCFLKVPLAALQERLKADRRRPLLQRLDRREFIAKLYRERLSGYEAAADKIIDAGAPPIVVAERVLAAFEKNN